MIRSAVSRKAWQHHFFYRKEVWKTTWKFKLAALLLLVIAFASTRKIWSLKLAQSLVCAETSGPSDALLLENFDSDYLVFERAEALRRAAVAPRALVPMIGVREEDLSNSYQLVFAKAMARMARLPDIEPVAVPNRDEPISLNAARQIRDVLVSKNVKSIIVVTPGFRSRRSFLVYDSVLRPAGIRVGCAPVLGTKRKENWTVTWHGIQDVTEQFVKLQYYQLWVLRNIR